MITAYLNDHEASYIDLKSVEVKNGWPHGLDMDSRMVHIPSSLILYIVDNPDAE